MNKLKENIAMAVGIVSLVGMIAAWATIPHRVSSLEKRADEYDLCMGSLVGIEERTKIMIDELSYMRKRIDDIAEKTH